MRFCVVCAMVLAVIGFAGCRDRSAPTTIERPPPTSSPETASAVPDLDSILDRMITTYQAAISYSDRATIQIIGKMSQSDAEPAPWNCVVAFQQPNRLRLQVNEGIFVSDGEDCYAQVRHLPDQVLHFPAPAQWTLETLFQDVHLDAAMELGLPRSVLRFPPQLVLLFANNPLNTFCPKSAKVEWVDRQKIGQIPCEVIQISHSDGNRILWISQENYALLRLDYQPVGLPVPEGFESIEAIRIEMTDARFDWDFAAETFQMLQPQDAVHVTEFHSDIPGLPAPEEHRRQLKLMTDSDTYRLIDQHIESVMLPEKVPPPKAAPGTFTLSQIWTQPLTGTGVMALLPGEPQKLLVPYESNVVAVLDLQGNLLQRIAPEELENSLVVDIQCSSFSGRQRVGIMTLDNKFYLFDESFKLLAACNAEPNEDTKEAVRDFQFFRHPTEELLLLGIQRDAVEEMMTPENPDANGIIRALDLQGTKRWEYSFEGIPNQISSAMIDNQYRVLVSCSAVQDSILVLSPEGTVFQSVEIAFGRHVLWFHILDSTIYTLLEYADTGDVRFVGFDMTGKSQWGRLLPSGEYEVDPVYVPGEKKWFVPSSEGVILVFDSIGNNIIGDTFSLNVVPTGLLCTEVDGETLLIIADGETVSAWKLGK